MSKDYPKNPREEAIERLLEATLESETSGTPDMAHSVEMADASGVVLYETDSPQRKRRLSFANVASAAALIIALAALGFVLFADIFNEQTAKTTDQIVEQGEDAPEKPEDRGIDFAPLGYQEALGFHVREWPTAQSAAELKTIVQSDAPTPALVLRGSQISAQVLKDAATGLPELESLALVSTPLENEDMDALLGFKKLRNLSISGGNVDDPFLMQAWLLKLFPDEVGGAVLQKIQERKAWCQQLVTYSTTVEFPMEAGSRQDPFVRLGAGFFDLYFRNLQMLQIPVRTFARFLRDKASENVGGLIELAPNLKHLSLTGQGISDDEIQGLATSIRRRSFLAGDDSRSKALLDLESFSIDLRVLEEGKDFTSRGLGYLRDGKIFVCEKLLSLTIHGQQQGGIDREIASLYPANFDALEELRIYGDRWAGSGVIKAWLGGIAAQDKPSALRRLVIWDVPLGNPGARELLKQRKLLPNLEFLHLRACSINLPLYRRLVSDFAPCEVKTWSGFDSKKNFIRVLPYMVEKENGKDVIDDSMNYVECFIHDLKTDTYKIFEDRIYVRDRKELGEYLPSTTFPLPISEDSFPDIYDSLELVAGEYEIVVIAEGCEIARKKLFYDGNGREDVLIKLSLFEYENRRPLRAKDTVFRYSIAGQEEDDRVDRSYLVQGDKVLEPSLYISYFDEQALRESYEPSGYFDVAAAEPIEVLLIVEGLPLLRIPFAYSRHFRKHAIWDGKKWTLEDIPLFKD